MPALYIESDHFLLMRYYFAHDYHLLDNDIR
jgi:hypothetical protein